MHRSRRAFTLIELLVVIGIIGLLVVIALAVGARVTGSGKERVTQSVIQVMDASMSEFVRATGSNAPATIRFRNPADEDEQAIYPVADAAWDTATGAMINSVGWYMKQCEKQASVADLFKGIDAALIASFEIDTPPGGAGWPADNPQMATALDAWGRPMRYVHPQFDGLIHGPNYKGGTVNASGKDTAVLLSDIIGPATAGQVHGFTQIRRNNLPGSPGSTVPDSDGGICPGVSPYFYSAGADGDPSTTEDNVYSARPKFQKAN